ncbi:MAG: endo-1,3(4)-beta-glucanase [Candidatus Marinimicrobia bacterium]|nr:endo-1,3(4)-beta-glucanase [Candidatus Neomarinimicrobiota bacterium]
MKNLIYYTIIAFKLINLSFGEIIQVGSGSYTNTFPGVDEAGRNAYPSGDPQVSGPALNKKIPTNDWWSSLIKNNHVSNLFNYPISLKTTSQGLVVSYIPWGVFDDQEPITVGLSGLSASRASVYDFSDWTVTVDWTDSDNSLKVTSGIGMPFLYFTKDSESIVEIVIDLGSVVVSDEVITIEDARNGADFIIYGPSGTTWNQSGSTYTSNLNGNNYWSMAMVPHGSSSLSEIASEYIEYAYVFPQNTFVSWSFDESSSILSTEFTVEVDIKEGQFTNMLQGMLPHQWNNLASDSPSPNGYSYETVRGELKTMSGNYFKTENQFIGVLPTLPALAHYSESYNPAELQNKVSQMENDVLPTWTDSYNEGQLMNRLIQTARIANEVGDHGARDNILETIKTRLEDWLTANSSEVAFLFYYNETWSTLIGYPAGHGQDSNINDHHFHWGYFIHAASFVEQFHPGWSADWGEMVNHLVRDAASINRDDSLYPFLRSFSPFAGHCWANGFATFPQGNDQESSSESMQFNSSLIHWGSVTGNDEIRDLGIYLYTTEQTAIDEYWFDMYERNFTPGYPYSLVSRVWGNSYDNGTFWTNDIAASYGIELYPIHGGSFYLSHNLDYVTSLWSEITDNTGILYNEANPNLWHDVYWQYLSFIDPQAAIELYNSYPDRVLKFGISDAQTYYWLHNMSAMGRLRSNITSDHPIAISFESGGQITYAAHNYTDVPIAVTFSDGFQLNVGPGQMNTNRGSSISGVINTDFDQAHVNGNINLYIESENQNITSVEFFNGSQLLGEISYYPFAFAAQNLSVGLHSFYGKIYSGSEFGLTNIVSVQVGEQVPYADNITDIPGTIEPGRYDDYEGGLGQNISYFDSSPYNHGTYRPDQYVDVEYFGETEGPTLGWVEAGEWTEYTIAVEEPGYYDLEFRYASDIPSGGGPFYLEINGAQISDNISVGNTGNWYSWASDNISDIELNTGEHILRLVFVDGGFNLGRLSFSFNRDLDYNPPVAIAGDDILITLPETSALLDGSSSYDADSENLSYQWEQIYGPTAVVISDQNAVQAEVTDLSEGTYKFKLTVDDGDHSSFDYILVYVSSSSDFPPTISLNTSSLSPTYYYGTSVQLSASAGDIDGTVELVEFYDGEAVIAEDSSEPYSFLWENISIGAHNISAQATDNDGLISISNTFSIEILEAPDCTGGPENGHYTYEFSDDLNNPTLTFIPSASHVGDPTCILYYATSGTPPGYYVTPNVPYQINASEGEVIDFYYTYSYNGLESNTADNPHSYEIGSCYNGDHTDEDITISFASNWDLIGLPLDVEESNYQSLFPESTEGTLYSYNGEQYIETEELQMGSGYWLHFESEGTAHLTGTPVNELTLELNAGWNLISGISSEVSLSGIYDPENIVVPGTVFEYTEFYDYATVLAPGYGYWIYASTAGSITISNGNAVRVDDIVPVNMYKLNSLTINGSELYFGISVPEEERLNYILPPKPPAGAFDVRFKGDSKAARAYGEIEVVPTTDFLNITYDVKIETYLNQSWILTSESGMEYTLDGSGEIIVPSEERFILELKIVIPSAFTLHESFPNPFNPITTLRYDLPLDALVTLSIYDMLGREIKQLVNTTQEAGFKSVQWDARDSMGKPVSAGVYLYQIRAGEFVQTKKMVLLK